MGAYHVRLIGVFSFLAHKGVMHRGTRQGILGRCPGWSAGLSVCLYLYDETVYPPGGWVAGQWRLHRDRIALSHELFVSYQIVR